MMDRIDVTAAVSGTDVFLDESSRSTEHRGTSAAATPLSGSEETMRRPLVAGDTLADARARVSLGHTGNSAVLPTHLSSDRLRELAGRPAVIMCTPNAGVYELFHRFSEAADMYLGLGFSVLVFNYRGYGRSTGTPSPDRCAQDAHMFASYLREELGITTVLAHGESIGGLAACALAGSGGADALVVDRSLDSLPTIARHMMGDWARVAVLALSRWSRNNSEAVITASCPKILVAAPTTDTVIPTAASLVGNVAKLALQRWSKAAGPIPDVAAAPFAPTPLLVAPPRGHNWLSLPTSSRAMLSARLGDISELGSSLRLAFARAVLATAHRWAEPEALSHSALAKDVRFPQGSVRLRTSPAPATAGAMTDELLVVELPQVRSHVSQLHARIPARSGRASGPALAGAGVIAGAGAATSLQPSAASGSGSGSDTAALRYRVPSTDDRSSAAPTITAGPDDSRAGSTASSVSSSDSADSLDAEERAVSAAVAVSSRGIPRRDGDVDPAPLRHRDPLTASVEVRSAELESSDSRLPLYWSPRIPPTFVDESLFRASVRGAVVVARRVVERSMELRRANADDPSGFPGLAAEVAGLLEAGGGDATAATVLALTTLPVMGYSLAAFATQSVDALDAALCAHAVYLEGWEDERGRVRPGCPLTPAQRIAAGLNSGLPVASSTRAVDGSTSAPLSSDGAVDRLRGFRGGLGGAAAAAAASSDSSPDLGMSFARSIAILSDLASRISAADVSEGAVQARRAAALALQLHRVFEWVYRSAVRIDADSEIHHRDSEADHVLALLAGRALRPEGVAFTVNSGHNDRWPPAVVSAVREVLARLGWHRQPLGSESAHPH